MDFKQTNRIFGFLALVISSIVYLMTVQDSVPFWDCGEFSAAAALQQVPHPPGAPLFLMIAKLFHLIPFGDPGWRINLVSVFSSSFTILFLYLITVKVINIFKGNIPANISETFAVCGSAFVGALAFTFSDTFWFNAVESEVYAMATLFVAIIVYLAMRWWEEADNEGHERYLILIAYLMGLSTGVHLLAILAIFSLVYMVFLRKYDITWKNFFYTSAIALIIFFVIYPGVVKVLPAFLAGHTSGRSEAREYAIENSPILTYIAIGIMLLAIYGFYEGYTKKKQLLTIITSSFIFIILGYTTYTQILIRSNTRTPMNENAPKTFSKLASYLGREQYGDDGSWPRRIKSEDYFIRNYTAKDDNGEYIYGEWYEPGTKQITRKDGSSITVANFDRVNIAGELTYLWKYQIYHMYLRYFNWNFIGRASDEQDAPHTFISKDDNGLNYKTGYGHLFPIRFFAFPFIIGLIGLIFHAQKDKKIASILFLMFLMMGVLAAIAQQQQNPQPRERDYFYTGSFMLWCMWIGIGVYSIIDSLSKKEYSLIKSISVVLILLMLVPVNMAAGGWKLHDRTGNYIPFDYSYNILQSVEKDAILFTNGDNDTFPLWYLQDVMGVRRDVRIVNLSLGNTLWYIEQLKNEMPWGAKKIPLSFPDGILNVDEETDPNALSYDFGEARLLSIPVKREILAQYTKDENVLNKGSFDVTFLGKPYGEQQGKQFYLYRVQDKLIQEILERIKFERPVYFSITVGPDAFCGLENYFRYEGMAMRICPVPQRDNYGDNYSIPIYEKTILNIDNSNDYHKEPHYGFKLRNLNNSNVYYDPVHRRLMSQYRQLYYFVARDILVKEKDTLKAKKVLDVMNKYISVKQFPLTFDFENKLAKMYGDLGDINASKEFAKLCIESTKEIISNKKLLNENFSYELTGYEGPFTSAYNSYLILKDYTGAKLILNQFISQLESVLTYIQNGEYPGVDPQRVQYIYVNSIANKYKLEVLPFEDKKDYKGAVNKLQEIIAKLQNEDNPANSQVIGLLMMRTQEIQAQFMNDNSSTISNNNINLQ